MEVSCMTRYCCSSTTNNTIANKQHSPYPYYPNWTIGDTCGFHTCEQANQRNPDLGGIGVLVAYCIEASILALSLIFYGLKLFTEHYAGWPGSKGRGLFDPRLKCMFSRYISLFPPSRYNSLQPSSNIRIRPFYMKTN
ncbi:hypothetical protein ABVK25_000926 [Lepraria finkii]|uniref:Uncharacterized protein n=1 Tax=Lepraria finkii TaxID=1340010 RepID=A0ABR4BSM1_9LECA